MPEVKLHNVKATIIGSSWLSPLKEIEIQLTFNEIVMEFQLSLLWLCAYLSQEWYGSQKRKGLKQLGKECNYFRTDWRGTGYFKYLNKFQCTSEPIIDLLPVLILIWKWLEVGYNSCHVIIIDGKAEFNKKTLRYDRRGLGATWESYTESACFMDLDNFN